MLSSFLEMEILLCLIITWHFTEALPWLLPKWGTENPAQPCLEQDINIPTLWGQELGADFILVWVSQQEEMSFLKVLPGNH